MIENKLVLSAQLIHGESPSHDDMQPLLQSEPQTNGSRTEDHRPNLARLILECTVEMPGRRSAQVRNLAFKPYLGKVRFEGNSNHGGQFRDGENLSRGQFERRKGQA